MKHANTKGFSLLEVLIVLAIVAVLALFAYPKYSSYLTKTRRIDGQVAILELASKLNEYYAIHHTYEHASFVQLDLPNHSPEGHYQLSINESNANNYKIIATPLRSQAKDHVCGSYTYNQAGDKGITGTGNLSECW